VIIQRILLAFDGSQAAEKAYDFALEVASKCGATLQVLAVAQPPEPAEDVETEAILEDAQEHYERAFVRLREKAAAAGIEPVFEVMVGHPALQIIHKAEEMDADHIIMGHRGKTLFEHWRVGSVTKRVLTHAHCSVTVVR
jgi:nucleotide-binding universal stress UspA family protein